MSRRSSGVSSTETAPMFFSKRCSFVVPGIGTIHGFWVSRQAGQVVGVLSSRDFSEQIEQPRFAFRTSGVKGGNVARKSKLPNFRRRVDLPRKETAVHPEKMKSIDPDIWANRSIPAKL
jgi:hypothetical protein